MASWLIDVSSVSDLDDDDDGWRLDDVDNAPILHTQSPSAFQAVPQRLAKLYRMRGELLFDGPADAPPDVLRKPCNILPNDTLEVFDAVTQSQALA